MTLNIAIAQLNFTVADIYGNVGKHLKAIEQAKQQGANLIVFSELSVCGYPPEDLLHRKDIFAHINKGIAQICQACDDIDAIIGYPRIIDGQVYNVGAHLHRGRIKQEHCKQQLPNYSVFDEQRYFKMGDQATVFECQGVKIGLLVCEDLWFKKPYQMAVDAGAELMISINASPFSIHKTRKRATIIKHRQQQHALPIIYVNQVGGQDDLLFDGRSFVTNHQGDVVKQLNAFEESVGTFDLEITQHNTSIQTPSKTDTLKTIYLGLVTGVRDYINKNHFPGAIIGLSGGIDSALTLAIASDALGTDRVQAVMMPSPYTAKMTHKPKHKHWELITKPSLSSLYLTVFYNN